MFLEKYFREKKRIGCGKMLNGMKSEECIRAKKWKSYFHSCFIIRLKSLPYLEHAVFNFWDITRL